MKIFNFKRNRILFNKAASLIIALSLIFSMGVCVKAEGESLLATLSVGDIPIELVDGQTVYNGVKIPVLYKNGVESFEVPKLKATTVNASHTVSVSENTINKENATATATVTVKNGDASIGTYTVNMDLIGINMYENGGMESGANKHFGWKDSSGSFSESGPGATVKRNQESAYTGSYGMERKMFCYVPDIYYVPETVLEGGKTYFASHMIKTAASETTSRGDIALSSWAKEEDATIDVAFYKGSQNEPIPFYSDSYNSGKKASRSAWFSFTPQTDWERHSAIMVTSKTTAAEFTTFCASGNYNVFSDDHFMGELVMADFDFSFNGEKVSKYISVGEGINGGQFSAVLLNQLGNTIGMDSTTISYELVSVTSGVSLTNDGKLTASKGANGTVTIKVTATPTAKWSNPAQDSFSKTLSFILVENTDNINSLTSISVGNQNIDIQKSALEYNVDFPVYYESGVEEFALPKVNATAEAGNTVYISQPVIDTENAKATYTITVSDDESEKNYKLNLNLIGVNMYQNGGFESGANNHVGYELNTSGKTNRDFCSVDPYIGRTDWAAYSGDWGLRRFLDGGASVYYRPDSNLKKGKTYLATQMVRVSEVENNPDNFPKDGIMNVLALTSGAKLNVEFYKTKQTLTTYKYRNNTANVINDPRMTFDRDWERIAAIITPSMDTVARFVITSYLSGFSCPIFTDDYFMGELVMGNISFYLDGEEAPEVISTEDGAISKSLRVQVENQLGETMGMNGKTTSSVALVSAPSGVTLKNGVLTIPQNTKGTVVLSATAKPTYSWSNCPQESFTKNISIVLENDEEYQSTLSSIKIGENEISLTDEVFEYNVNVPVSYPEGVESFTLPEISAIAKDGFQAVVSNPVIDGSTATATVTVKDGNAVLETYTLNMNLIGINMYTNGGMESGENKQFGWKNWLGMFTQSASGTSVKRNTASAYTGRYGLERKMYCVLPDIYYVPEAVLEGGKTYFASHMIKTAASETTSRNDILLSSWAKEEDATIDVAFYRGTQKEPLPFYSDSYSSGKKASRSAWFSFTPQTDWERHSAIMVTSKTTAAEFTTFCGSGNYNVYTDDHFMGELVATGLDLTFNNKISTSQTETTVVEDTVSTKNNIQTTLGVYGVNQLGNNTGLTDKLTAEFELIDAPTGVLLEGDTLTIPSNTAGTVTIKAVATTNANWKEAPLEKITDIISFELIPEIGFTLEYYEDYITSKLGYTNKTGAPLDVVIYYVTYIQDEISALVTDVITEKTTIGIGETLSRERDIHIKDNEMFKCFLWKEETLFPLVENAYTD